MDRRRPWTGVGHGLGPVGRPPPTPTDGRRLRRTRRGRPERERPRPRTGLGTLEPRVGRPTPGGDPRRLVSTRPPPPWTFRRGTEVHGAGDGLSYDRYSSSATGPLVSGTLLDLLSHPPRRDVGWGLGPVRNGPDDSLHDRPLHHPGPPAAPLRRSPDPHPKLLPTLGSTTLTHRTVQRTGRTRISLFPLTRKVFTTREVWEDRRWWRTQGIVGTVGGNQVR